MISDTKPNLKTCGRKSLVLIADIYTALLIRLKYIAWSLAKQMLKEMMLNKADIFHKCFVVIGKLEYAGK